LKIEILSKTTAKGNTRELHLPTTARHLIVDGEPPRWEGAEDACMIFIPAEKPKSLPNDDGGGVIIPVKLTFESTARSFFKL